MEAGQVEAGERRPGSGGQASGGQGVEARPAATTHPAPAVVWAVPHAPHVPRALRAPCAPRAPHALHAPCAPVLPVHPMLLVPRCAPYPRAPVHPVHHVLPCAPSSRPHSPPPGPGRSYRVTHWAALHCLPAVSHTNNLLTGCRQPSGSLCAGPPCPADRGTPSSRRSMPRHRPVPSTSCTSA